jgi:hypothetical protein
MFITLEKALILAGIKFAQSDYAAALSVLVSFSRSEAAHHRQETEYANPWKTFSPAAGAGGGAGGGGRPSLLIGQGTGAGAETAAGGVNAEAGEHASHSHSHSNTDTATSTSTTTTAAGGGGAGGAGTSQQQSHALQHRPSQLLHHGTQGAAAGAAKLHAQAHLIHFTRTGMDDVNDELLSAMV